MWAQEHSAGFIGVKGKGSRPRGCRMGAAGTADPASLARWTTAQDRDAGGDECYALSAAHRLSVALPAKRGFSARSTVYNIFRKFQCEGT
jgi:hypothetical protein